MFISGELLGDSQQPLFIEATMDGQADPVTMEPWEGSLGSHRVRGIVWSPLNPTHRLLVQAKVLFTCLPTGW